MDEYQEEEGLASDQDVAPDPDLVSIRMPKLNVSGKVLGKLASLLDQLKGSSDEYRSKQEKEWDQNRKDFKNLPTGALATIYKGPSFSDIPFPCCSPRANALFDYVTGGLFGASPIMTASSSDSAVNTDDRQSDVEFLIQRGGLEEVMRARIVDAWTTNHQIIACTWDHDRQLPKFEAIRPENFLCAGFGSLDTERATMIGHLLIMSKTEIEAASEDGRFDHVPDDYKPTAKDQDGSGDYSVDLADAIIRVNLSDVGSGRNRKQYRVLFEPDKKVILHIEEYRYEKRWYFNFGLKPADPDHFWSTESLGNDMQGPHLAWNMSMNLLVQGGFMDAFPIPVVPATVQPTSKDQRNQTYYTVGEKITSVQDPHAAWSPHFNGQAIAAILPTIERAADAVARISPTAYGQATEKQQTATETTEQAQGTQQGINGYVATYSRPMIALTELLNEYLATHFTEIKARHGDRIRAQSANVFSLDVDWDVNGKNASANPIVIRNNIGGMLEMLGKIGDPAVQAGIDMGEVAQTIVSSYRLPNADKIYDPQKVEQARAMMQQQAMQEQQSAGDETELIRGIQEGMSGVKPNAMELPQAGEVPPMANGFGIPF